MKKFYIFAVLFLINSCAFLNPREVSVGINSNPPGANINIDGQEYGQTPKIIELEPGPDYNIVLRKEGYEPASLKLDWYHSVRGGKGVQTRRCVLDTLAVVPFVLRIFDSYSVRCKDFKQSNYSVNLVPRQGGFFGSQGGFPQNYQNSFPGNFPPQNRGMMMPGGGQMPGSPGPSPIPFMPIPGGPPGAPGHGSQQIRIPGGENQAQPYGNQDQYQPSYAPGQGRSYAPGGDPEYYQDYLNRQRQFSGDPYRQGNQNFNVPDGNDSNNWQ